MPALLAEHLFHIPDDRFNLRRHWQELPDLPVSALDPDAARYAVDVALLSRVTSVSFAEGNCNANPMICAYQKQVPFLMSSERNSHGLF
jgi:hypothetical protein